MKVTENLSLTKIVLGTLAIVGFLVWLGQAPEPPDCVEYVGSEYDKVKVETDFENQLPVKCDAEDVNVWLEKNEYELAHSDITGRVYVKTD